MKRTTSIRLAFLALAAASLVFAEFPAAAAPAPRASVDPIEQPAVPVDLGEPIPEPVATSHRFAGVSIPAGITELTVVYGPEVSSVDCYLTTGDPHNMIGWRYDEPVAGGDSIHVVPGRVVAGEQYWLHCRLPQREDEWVLDAVLPPSSEATVSAVGTSYLTEIHEYFAFAPVSFAAAPDQPVDFTAEPGTLPPGAEVMGTMWVAREEGERPFNGEVSADGGHAVAPVMNYMAFFYVEDPSRRSWTGQWQTVGPMSVSDGVTTVRHLRWTGQVSVFDAPSAVTVSLSASKALSVQRVKAFVQVTAPLPESSQDDNRRGTIVLKVDGVPVASSGMYASRDGRWVVELPRLKRGAHVVTAEYEGWTWLAGSVSEGDALRILL